MTLKWLQFFGDFRAGSELLGSKPCRSPWLLLMFLDALCRAFGQVVFANNPVSGLIIILALLIAQPIVACSGIFTATVAIAFSWLQGEPRGAVSAGLTAYCAVLVGTVTMSLLTPHYTASGTPVLWAALFVGALLSVYVTAAASNVLGALRPALPCLTLPFNVVACVLLTCLSTHMRDDGDHDHDHDHDNDGYHDNNTAHVDFTQVLTGSLLSAGQVYAVESMEASLLMYLAMLMFSPIMTVAAFTGALLGTLTGVMTLGRFGLAMAGSGVLGYNSLLSAAAVGGMFYVISWRSSCAAIFNAIMTSFVQVTFLCTSTTFGESVLTLPFVISTLVFLATSADKEGVMARPDSISFPEMHRMQHWRQPQQ